MTVDAYRKPLPFLADSDALPYWQAAQRGELALQRCADCRQFVHPPGPGCPHCGSAHLAYETLGSRITGKLYSYSIAHRAFVPGFEGECPYVLALVDVEQAPGVRIIANLRGCPPDAVRIGMPVRMIWEACTPDVTLPQWTPA